MRVSRIPSVPARLLTLLLTVAGDGDRLLLLLPPPVSPPPGEGTPRVAVAGPGEGSLAVMSIGWVIFAGAEEGEATGVLSVASAGRVSLTVEAVVSTEEELVGTSVVEATVVVTAVAMVVAVVLFLVSLVLVAGDLCMMQWVRLRVVSLCRGLRNAKGNR